MRLGAAAGGGHAVRDQLSGLREACRKKQRQTVQREQEPSTETAEDVKPSREECSPGGGGGAPEATSSSSSEASDGDGDVLLWSSLDLAPIC